MVEDKGWFIVLSTLNSVKKQTYISVSKTLVLKHNTLLILKLKHYRKIKANEVLVSWMKSSRGVYNRLKRGVELSLKNNFQCYAPAKYYKKYGLKKFKYVKKIRHS
ncbi:MAG: hypothetical protein CMO44_12000 [Verrucomicrobiales bacterium]|nr:hypothetical protein [Verrucomicrobiales bacterium]|tara:strand:- start:1049 stop:1366 length:318 start_codon:yes stop_codon:yes gene_type:complete